VILARSRLVLMLLAIRWVVILSLFLLAWIVPARWLHSPNVALALGILIGGLTAIVLDDILRN
jgi:hypothetical protein